MIERMVENLNRALLETMRTHDDLFVLGQDLADPYSGAFKVSRGLSTEFPDRVLSTPISETATAGLATGIALAGGRAVMEVMFGDFLLLAADPLVNLAAKSVSMYGRRVPVPVVVRVPSGAGRGYGATHSQSLAKHFMGVPDLELYEMSPFHDSIRVLTWMLGRERPCLHFEDKRLYARRMYAPDSVRDVFELEMLQDNWARVFVPDVQEVDVLLISGGATAERALDAAYDLLVEDEITCEVVIPSRLYPFDHAAVVDLVARAQLVCVVEESTAGAGWGTEVAAAIYREQFQDLARRVELVTSANSIIPSARHLEDEVVVSSLRIREQVKGALRD